MDKWIYYFGSEGSSGSSSLAKILGSKGANLAEMSNLGMPVPKGFTISVDLCNYYYNNNFTLPNNFREVLRNAVETLERNTNKSFSSINNPLLLSVRSGSAVSMPGMMDTILNLGINDEVVSSLASITQNEYFAKDSYMRFIQMYGSTVLGIESYMFEDIIESSRNSEKDLTLETITGIISDFKNVIHKHAKDGFYSDPYYQLELAIIAVLKSWMSNRAIAYRKMHNISDDIWTAVTIQEMVFGNMGENSGTGVVFTRSPSDGTNKIFGEFLLNAQGEDIVSGTKTPSEISSLEKQMPKVYAELQQICMKLESHYKDTQDIEFTIEDGKLYILQTRSAKRTISAAIKIAVDMVNEGMISKNDAIKRIDSKSVSQLLHTGIDHSKATNSLTQGLAASPGAASGIVVFSAQEAQELSKKHDVILVRTDTSPEDIQGMFVAKGILTTRGGMTSHAAVVARGIGKPCVCGAGSLVVNEVEKYCKIGATKIESGTEITIDGSTGKVFLGSTPLIETSFSSEFEQILDWADEIASLEIRANADTILDAKQAMKFKATGIGLCRTEHMFFEEERLRLIRQVILSSKLEERKRFLDELLPLHAEDFRGILEVISEKPINIRLLDPPLHEFLPQEYEEKVLLAEKFNLPIEILLQRIDNLSESNPMLGHRGCRLGISTPEVYKMQILAILTAAKSIFESQGIKSSIEIMIPFINDVRELDYILKYVNTQMVDAEKFCKYKIGTMIELPRAALLAGDLAKKVEYFSFGTNDLTQTTYGISRDDIARFLPCYLEYGIYTQDPFVRLDVSGVGELIEIAIKRGRDANRDLTFGICGEHAGDPESIEFFHKSGLDYVSCSPYRIPVARLSAAQSSLLVI